MKETLFFHWYCRSWVLEYIRGFEVAVEIEDIESHVQYHDEQVPQFLSKQRFCQQQ